MFGFQKLDVYRCATQFLAAAAPLSGAIPRGYSPLADQLRRAALSVPLNIAEASGRSAGDARRSYAIARGSTLECAAILDALETLGFTGVEQLAKPRELLDRMVAMLTVLVRASPSASASASASAG